MKVFFLTLGCKVNQYESQAMLGMLENSGYTAAESEADCDVIIINSCTVTSTGDQKMRQTLHKARRTAPNAVIVLTGCMPQAFPEEAAKLLGDADIIMGNRVRHTLPELLEQFFLTHQPILAISAHENGDAFEPMQVSHFHERTRAFLKIQDGCNRFCSYCIIPMARGRVRSKKPADLRAEVEAVSRAGYREVVLVGINLSAYGQEMGLNLADAVEIACAVPGIDRVRLGSLEPDKMDDDIIRRLAAQPKLCPQFHLALQSGCDKTLKAMHRHYSAADYAEIADKLRATFPDCSVTTDLMVGFPGETEADFAESLAFMQKVAFAKTHVFPYSMRPGTLAAKMPQLSKSVKEARARTMIAAAERVREAFLQTQVGNIYPVLFETASAKDTYIGYTPNYSPVQVHSECDLQNKICTVRMLELHEGTLLGEII